MTGDASDFHNVWVESDGVLKMDNVAREARLTASKATANSFCNLGILKLLNGQIMCFDNDADV